MEVKHEGLSELRLRLRLQPVLLLRRLINGDGGKAAREALPTPTARLGPESGHASIPVQA